MEEVYIIKVPKISTDSSSHWCSDPLLCPIIHSHGVRNAVWTSLSPMMIGFCYVLSSRRACEYIFTRGQFWYSGIVVVCDSVCVRVFASASCPRDNPFKLELLNWDQKCKAPRSRSLSFFRLDWPWPSRQLEINIYPIWACRIWRKSSSTQVRIAKLGPKMLINTFKILINGGLEWPRPSISLLILIPYVSTKLG